MEEAQKITQERREEVSKGRNARRKGNEDRGRSQECEMNRIALEG